MSPVTRYIRRATAGLPERTRLDAAAELRVHLNARIQHHMAQGFDRAEAEHLAVEQMGPAEPVNRSFLGHVLTPRLGWIAVVILVIGFGGWFSTNYLFAPAAVVRERTMSVEELLPFMGDLYSVELTLPRDTLTISYGISHGFSPYWSGATNVVERHVDLRPNQRLTIPLTVGFLNPGLAATPCDAGSRHLLTMMGPGDSLQGCLELPSVWGQWQLLEPEGLAIQNDTWQPFLLFRPVIEVNNLLEGQRAIAGNRDGYQVHADPDSWLVVSIHASQAPIEEFESLPPQPTVTEVFNLYPWLAWH